MQIEIETKNGALVERIEVKADALPNATEHARLELLEELGWLRPRP